MSERSCNKCCFGKCGECDGIYKICENCILKSGFIKSSSPVRILEERQPVKDDRTDQPPYDAWN